MTDPSYAQQSSLAIQPLSVLDREQKERGFSAPLPERKPLTTKERIYSLSGLLYSDGINCTSDAGRPIYGLLVAYPEAGLPLLE